MSSFSTAAMRRQALSTPLAFLAATVCAAVVSSLVNVLIAVLAHAAGASPAFLALQPQVFLVFTAVGTLAGVVGWTVIRSRSARPAAVLRWLVPTVLVLSFIPDLLVGFSGGMPGTSWTAVVGLMLMHVSVTAAAVLSLRTFLPVPGEGARS